MLRTLGFAALILAPLGLLADPHAAFYGDWNTHLWVIGYYGEYFREHGHMPAALNSVSAIGVPLPIFYGALLYPGLGFLSSALGAALALRTGIVLLVSFQACALGCAGRSAFRDRTLAYAVAAAVIWSTYSLTNLYNRSAVAEFFGTGFMVSAIAFAIAAAGEYRRRRRRICAWLAAASAVLTLGSHPPTALLALPALAALSLILGAVLILTRAGQARAADIFSLAPLALGAAILSPCACAYLELGAKLRIVEEFKGLVFFRDRCDSFLGRFSPFPYDLLSLRRGTDGVSTPYLEAPIIGALCLILLLNLELWRRGRLEPPAAAASLWDSAARAALIAALAGFVFFTALSLSYPLARHFRFLGPYVQFAYRLVAHANAALLVAVFASGALAAQKSSFLRYEREMQIGAAVALTLAAVGLGVKLTHAAAVMTESAPAEFDISGCKSRLLTSDFSQLAREYSTPAQMRELDRQENAAAVAVALPVSAERGKFGLVGPVTVELPAEAWAVTNVVNFPWNGLSLGGRQVSGSSLARKGEFLAVFLPKGRSTLQWAWRPVPLWIGLHRLAAAASVLFVLASGWTARARRHESGRL